MAWTTGTRKRGRCPGGLAGLVLGFLLVASCQPPANRTDDSPSPADIEEQALDWQPMSLPSSCQEGPLRILQTAPWPGHGLATTVALRPEPAEAQVLLEGLSVAVASQAPQVPVTAPFVPPVHHVAILLVDALPETHFALHDVLAELDERVAVGLFEACPDGLTQRLSFGLPRAALVGALNGLSTCPHEMVDLDDVLVALANELERVGSPLPALRSLVVVDANGPGDAVQSIANRPLFSHWLPPDELHQLPLLLQDDRRALYVLGSCHENAPEAVTVSAPDEPPFQCPLTPAAAPPEEETLPCDAEAIATGTRSYPETLAFHFTPAQRAIYDARVAARDQADFTLSIGIGNAEPVAATAHLRGQTSLDCQRKSYTVNLLTNRPRHLVPGAATDEFYLLSMCKDDRYFQQLTANLLARDHGLFPLRFGLVELRVEDETEGVYLLLEKTKEALLQDHSKVAAVIRRRFDPDGSPPEVKYPDSEQGAAEAAAAYGTLLDLLQDKQGAELTAEAERHLDLDQFLTYLAFQSVLQNGDYVDEVIFLALERKIAPDSPPWFRVVAWDMDDLFSPCHHNGKHALEDPYGLLYCVEGTLEKALLADPLVYARYVEAVEHLLDETLTAKHLDGALAQVQELLLPWFERPDLCAAMTVLVADHPEAADPEVAQADILAHMEELRSQYQARAELLRQRIAAWREPGGP